MSGNFQIPFPVPGHGFAQNSKLRVNLDAIVAAINATGLNVTTDGTGIVGLSNINSTYLSGFRNRVLNGDLLLDQVNEGAAVTFPNGTAQVSDMWKAVGNSASFLGTVTNATATPPTGFSHYLHVACTSTFSITSGLHSSVETRLEGYTVRDLNFGTSSAATVTLSFWARTSNTGTFGGVITNSATDRSYPFTYSLPNANTWTQISVTIAGDTTGTWLSTNGIGVTIRFDLGSGSTFQGASGSWSANNYYGITSGGSIMNVSGATWDITGVQLEIGSIATYFEYLPFEEVLRKCQRYYAKTFGVGVKPAQNAGTRNALSYVVTVAGTAGPGGVLWHFPSKMRIDTPSITVYNPSNTNTKWVNISAATDSGASSIIANGGESYQLIRNPQTAGEAAGHICSIHASADAQL